MTNEPTLHTNYYLSASRIAVGHCVIINDVDCPEGKLVAVVSDVQPDRVTAMYLSEDVGMLTCSAKPRLVTPVEHFGVRVVVSGRSYCCTPDSTLEHIAKYPDLDREPRYWQERKPPRQHHAKIQPLSLAVANIESTVK